MVHITLTEIIIEIWVKPYKERVQLVKVAYILYNRLVLEDGVVVVEDWIQDLDQRALRWASERSWTCVF